MKGGPRFRLIDEEELLRILCVHVPVMYVSLHMQNNYVEERLMKCTS